MGQTNYKNIISKSLLFKISFLFIVFCLGVIEIESVKGAVLIDNTTLPVDSTMMGTNRDMCRDSNGRIHLSYKGNGNDVWYGNSTDNGTTWTKKNIVSGDFSYVGIVCKGGDDLTVFYVESGNLKGINSTNGGSSFSSNYTIADTGSIISPSCEADEVGIVHCSYVSSERLYYVNSTSFNSETIVNNNTADGSNYAALVVAPDNCVYIVAAGQDQDDLNYWSPCLNGWGGTNRVQINDVGFLNNGQSISVMFNNNELYISLSYVLAGNRFKLCHGEPGSSFVCNIFDGTVNCYFSSLVVNTKVVNVACTNYYNADTNSNILQVINSPVSSINFTSTQTSLSTFYYPNSRGSHYPASNRVINRHDIVYQSGGKLYFDSFSLPYNTPSAPTDITGIPDTLFVGDMLNVTASGSVDPVGLNLTYYYKFYNIDDC